MIGVGGSYGSDGRLWWVKRASVDLAGAFLRGLSGTPVGPDPLGLPELLEPPGRCHAKDQTCWKVLVTNPVL